MPPVNEDCLNCCCGSCCCHRVFGQRKRLNMKTSLWSHAAPSLRISRGQSRLEPEDICSTSTAPRSSAFSSVLSAQGSDNPHYQRYRCSRQTLASSSSLSSHKSRALLLGNHPGPLGVPRPPPSPCFPSSLPYWHWIARRALHTLIRKMRPLQKGSLLSPWIFTSPCHTAKT